MSDKGDFSERFFCHSFILPLVRHYGALSSAVRSNRGTDLDCFFWLVARGSWAVGDGHYPPESAVQL